MEPFKIALIGECMIEIQEVSPGEVQQTFGGDTLNTAIYMSRLAKNLPVDIEYVTAVGADHFSDAMIEFWEKEKVGSSLVQRIENKRPGLYYIQVDDEGERYFHYWRSEAAARHCFEYPGSEKILTALGDYDAIYLSGISLAILLPKSLEQLLIRLAALHEMGTEIYFDCNFRLHLWQSEDLAIKTYHEIFSLSHTVLLNVDEGAVLLNQDNDAGIHQVLSALGVVESVIRNGEKPCSIFYAGKQYTIPANPVQQVVDTTAAGDSFSAAYLLARKAGKSIKEATVFAHEVAGQVIGKSGAVVDIRSVLN